MDTKWGQRYTGLMLSCDRHMNIHLGDVVKTTVRATVHGDIPMKINMREAFIKGVGINCIKMDQHLVSDYKSHKES